MAKLKFLMWNVEWMNDLFTTGTGPAAFRPDGEKPLHNKDTTVKVRRDHLSGVLKEIGPDIVVVAEGPSRRRSWLSKMPDGTPIYTRYKHASDHFPISVDINT